MGVIDEHGKVLTAINPLEAPGNPLQLRNAPDNGSGINV
jgi:hypothetical protein